MPHLTARDIHFVHAQVRREESALASLPDWNHLNDDERVVYERMAELLNEKLTPPMLVATGKLTDVDPFTVILAIGTPEDTEQTVRLKAHNALFDSGLGDGTRDMLRGTLAIQPIHEFLCEPLTDSRKPYKPEMEMK